MRRPMKHIGRRFLTRLMGMTVFTAAACAEAATPTWDYSFITEITIDRPANEVWPYFFGRKREMWSRVTYIEISGEPGKVGEIYAMADAFHGRRTFFET